MGNDNGMAAVEEPVEAMEVDDPEPAADESGDLTTTVSPTQAATTAATSRSAAACSTPTSGKNALPSARVKTIMRSAPESMAIGADAVFAVSRATVRHIHMPC